MIDSRMRGRTPVARLFTSRLDAPFSAGSLTHKPGPGGLLMNEPSRKSALPEKWPVIARRNIASRYPRVRIHAQESIIVADPEESTIFRGFNWKMDRFRSRLAVLKDRLLLEDSGNRPAFLGFNWKIGRFRSCFAALKNRLYCWMPSGIDHFILFHFFFIYLVFLNSPQGLIPSACRSDRANP